MMKATKLEKIKGCMFGGAVGDALGYPVEFRSAEEIFHTYGRNGISHYELFYNEARISDDTQMTLFTAVGLIATRMSACLNGGTEAWQDYVRIAYKYWLKTQSSIFELEEYSMPCWLMDYEEFYNRRAPGNTCLSALYSEEKASIRNKINHSKGCGGVMRVAPVGLYLAGLDISIEEVDMVAAEIAAITHSHPLGYIPAATVAHIVARCVLSNDDLTDIIKEALDTTRVLFSEEKYIDEFSTLMEKAVQLAESDMDDLEAIQKLGEGWVAEETLAIAIYCALKYKNDFAKAVIASVNHDGDSDSTGAVTGNILGAYLGINAIPEEYIQPLELKEVIEEISMDLYEDCERTKGDAQYDEKWLKKYGTLYEGCRVG